MVVPVAFFTILTFRLYFPSQPRWRFAVCQLASISLAISLTDFGVSSTDLNIDLLIWRAPFPLWVGAKLSLVSRFYIPYSDWTTAEGGA